MAAAVLACSCLLLPRPKAAAQDKLPYLLAEPTEFTDVIDAFEDDDDPLDFNIRLSYARTQQDSLIERERSAAGAFAVDTIDVARYRAIRSELVLSAELGLYHDLMVYARLPLVFSDTRELRLPEAAACESTACRERRRTIERVLSDAPPEVNPSTPGASTQLFDPDPELRAKTRSGVPSVDVGIAWGITNQYRTPELPTWVVLLEGRFSVGQAMRACALSEDCDAGNSRGTTRVQLGTRWSYRYRFVEPYLGLDYALEWASADEQPFETGSDGPYLADTDLPRIGGFTLGGSFVPWEQRGRFQQLAIDLRGRAEYISAGRDYSPLFDALGGSTNPYLRTPFVSDGQEEIEFTGITNVDAHARLSLDLGLMMQAARYVRFRLGLLLSHVTTHLLNTALPCTHENRASGRTSVECMGKEQNALYRPVIDLPGQRFLVTSDFAYSLSATATGQF